MASRQGLCAWQAVSPAVLTALSPLLFQVNGERVSLPHALGSLGSVTRIRNLVTIQTPANVEIQFNGRHTLFVRVGPEYRARLCGMCGNFNDIRRDDKVLPSGERARSDAEFGNAWKSEPSPARSGILTEQRDP